MITDDEVTLILQGSTEDLHKTRYELIGMSVSNITGAEGYQPSDWHTLSDELKEFFEDG